MEENEETRTGVSLVWVRFGDTFSSTATIITNINTSLAVYSQCKLSSSHGVSVCFLICGKTKNITIPMAFSLFFTSSSNNGHVILLLGVSFLAILCIMKIARLSQVSHSDIHAAFLRAFSDYQIPVKETLEEMAVENRQRGIDYDASFGAFADNGELVGFLFCGVRNDEGALYYYDGGTAIIPEWRGRGIGGLLLDTVLPDAKSRGAYDFILEVIQDNVNARKLYESRGFSISRNLRCYKKSLKDIPLMESFSYTIKTPEMDEYREVSKSLSLPYIPSWQNTNASVLSIFEHLITRVLSHGGKPVGYFVLNPQTGHILQMSALGGSPSIYSELMSLVRTCTMADSVKFINIDESSTFITFLEENGWDRYIDQYEMIKCFKPTS